MATSKERVEAFTKIIRDACGVAAISEARATVGGACDWCGAGGAALAICQCGLAAFCGKTCAALAWKGGVNPENGRWRPPHKRFCTKVEARAETTVARLPGDLAETPLDAAVAALKLTDQRVDAAVAVLGVFLSPGRVPRGTTDAEVLSALSAIFGSAGGPEELRRIEAGLDPAVAATLAARRAAYLRETASAAERAAPAARSCDAIYAGLRDTLGGCMVVRYRATRPDQPPPVHRTNRDLLAHLHEQISAPDAGRHEAAPHRNIPAFLALADELLTPPIEYAPNANDGRPPRVIKPCHATLREQTADAWREYAAVEAGGGDDAAVDAAVDALKRREEFDRLEGLEAVEMEKWLRGPGRWLSKQLANLEAPPEPSPRGRKPRPDAGATGS